MNHKDKATAAVVEKKKFSKNGKGKRAYIPWEENDSTTSCSLKEDEEINMCLMGKENSEVRRTASSTSENYSTLLQAFHETHEEANRLASVNNRLKGLNNWLEKRVIIGRRTANC